jgi:hypothetical protein
VHLAAARHFLRLTPDSVGILALEESLDACLALVVDEERNEPNESFLNNAQRVPLIRSLLIPLELTIPQAWVKWILIVRGVAQPG